jgi:hypothetical protein
MAEVEISKPMTPAEMAIRMGGLEMELANTKNDLELLKLDHEELQIEHKAALARTELQLNLHNPFEKVINDMVQLQRVKSQDYAAEGDILKNMREVVAALGIPTYTVVEDCNAMVIRKTARINNLRGRTASNESLWDSYLDRAVYAVLACVALHDDYDHYDYDDEVVDDL